MGMSLYYTMSKRVNPSINALSTLIIGIITIVLVLVNVIPMLKDWSQKKAAEKAEKEDIIKS